MWITKRLEEKSWAAVKVSPSSEKTNIRIQTWIHNICWTGGSETANIRETQACKSTSTAIVCLASGVSCWHLYCTCSTALYSTRNTRRHGPFSTPVNTWESSYRLAKLQPNVNTQQTEIFPDPAAMEDPSLFSCASHIKTQTFCLKTPQKRSRVTIPMSAHTRENQGALWPQMCQMLLILWPTAWLSDIDIGHMVWKCVFVPLWPLASQALPCNASKLITITLGSYLAVSMPLVTSPDWTHRWTFPVEGWFTVFMNGLLENWMACEDSCSFCLIFHTLAFRGIKATVLPRGQQELN